MYYTWRWSLSVSNKWSTVNDVAQITFSERIGPQLRRKRAVSLRPHAQVPYFTEGYSAVMRSQALSNVQSCTTCPQIMFVVKPCWCKCLVNPTAIHLHWIVVFQFGINLQFSRWHLVKQMSVKMNVWCSTNYGLYSLSGLKIDVPRSHDIGLPYCTVASYWRRTWRAELLPRRVRGTSGSSLFDCPGLLRFNKLRWPVVA